VNSEFADQASDHDPQVVRIRPVAATPKTDGTVTVLPHTTLQGTLVLVHLEKFDANARLTVAIDGTKAATVTTSKRGTADVILPLSFTKVLPGSHTITATTPSGATASATFTVIKWPFGARRAV
jgi:hypothetical protein